MLRPVAVYVILRELENRVLKKICGPKGQNLTRRFRNLHNFNSSISIIRAGQTRREKGAGVAARGR
jgi:hypothetical protein